MDDKSDDSNRLMNLMYSELKGFNMAQMFSLSNNNSKANKFDKVLNEKFSED